MAQVQHLSPREIPFSEVWNALGRVIEFSPTIKTLQRGKENRLRWHAEQGIEVATDKGSDLLPRDWFESTWAVLCSAGILTVEDFPHPARFRSSAIAAILSQLPWIDYTVYPRIALFLVEHRFTNDQLCKTFGVGWSGGIRYAGNAKAPKLVVFTTEPSDGENADHPYQDRWENGYLYYTGWGLEGDQAFTRGNLALYANLNADFPIYGFKKEADNRYTYLGRFKVENVLQESQLDKAGRPRQAYVFQMRRLETSPIPAIWEPAPTAEAIPAPAADVLPDLTAICDAFGNALKESHLSFGPRHDQVVRSFVVSLATKPFVILTGLSGSGKTQIALQFGAWLGEGRHKLVPVRPDWTGPEALLGYEDALLPVSAGRRAWFVPEALEFMLRAARDPDNPYLLILDEMNLAHVERYFADVLSGMESGEPVLPNLQRDQDGHWRTIPDQPSKIPFPKNLFIVGTVNVDETTYMFSPKVLDRANTIEFRVATDDLDPEIRKPRKVQPGDPALVRGFLAIATDADWHLRNPGPHHSVFVDSLRILHRLLAEGGCEFGHRVFYEAVRFAALLAAAGDPDPEHALDLQVMQKILPRLHGSRRRLEATLCTLGRFCFDLTTTPQATETGARLFDPLRPPPGIPKLPLSFAKVQRMTRSLRANQFISFTE